MLVVIDLDYDSNGQPIAFHTIDASNPTAMQTIADLHSGKTALVGSGWEVVSKLPAIPDGTTRFQVVQLHAQKAAAPQQLKTAIGVAATGNTVS